MILSLSTHPVNVPFTPKIHTPFLIFPAVKLEDPTIVMVLRIKVIRRVPRDLEILLMTLISNSRRFILDITIFGIRGTFTGWVDDPIDVSTIGPFGVSRAVDFNRWYMVEAGASRILANVTGMVSAGGTGDENIATYVEPYFGYLRTHAALQFYGIAGKNGRVWLWASHQWYYNSTPRTSDEALDTYNVISTTGTTTIYLSGSRTVDIYGNSSTHPYIYGPSVRVENLSNGNIQIMLTSLQFQFTNIE